MRRRWRMCTYRSTHVRDPPSIRRYKPLTPPTACEPSTRSLETSNAVISRIRFGMAQFLWAIM